MSALSKSSAAHPGARGDRSSYDAAQQGPGVLSPLISLAGQRVAGRLLEESAEYRESEHAASLLAACALAIDRPQIDVLSVLPPHPSAQLGERLVQMLRTELLRSWTEGESRTRPSLILNALARVEQVRLALEQSLGQPLGEALSGPDALDQFVEVVHDLRSPLSSILFLGETLLRGRSGEVNKLQRRQLGLIYSAALGLSTMVSDALDLARGGDELTDGEPCPLSLSELLQSVADIVRPTAEEKGLRVGLSPIEPDRRLGHLLPLTRVLLNLTTNALKFTERGSVEIICTAKGPGRVEFAVRDTGRGINPLTMASLYQPFRRARGRSGYCFSGTGLGLAITRKLVAAIGSELRLETGEWGTRFYFELELPPLTSP